MFCPLHLNRPCYCAEEKCGWYSQEHKKCIVLAVGEGLIKPVSIKPYNIGDVFSSFFPTKNDANSVDAERFGGQG